MTDRRPTEPSNRDLIDGAVRKIVTAVVIAGGLIALGIYARPGPPRYQAFEAAGRIVRINTESGTIIACEEKACMLVVQRGQSLGRSLPAAKQAQPTRALPAPRQEPQPARALPAPGKAIPAD